MISFSLVAPYVGVPHAGGEFYRRHLGVLEELGHDVTVIVPSTELNRRAAARPGAPGALILVEAGRRMPMADAVWALLRPDAVAPSMRRAFHDDADVREARAQADVIEVHWAEMAFTLERRPRAAGSFLIAHDIPLQREWRWLVAAWQRRVLRKLIWRAWRTTVVAVTQVPALRAADVTLVLSSKDAVLATRMTRAPSITVIDPPLWSGDEARGQGEDEEIALFVAAFGRRENVEAAVWLLERIWPIVCSEQPDARLILAGDDPPSRLVDLAERTPGVTVTGYVESLEALYEQSRVALVPLQSGAGVKFKTIEALVRGKRIVSTSIGAEGITDDSGAHPFVVVDDALAFARETAAALRVAGQADPTVTEWARVRYGRAGYAAAVQAVLSGSIASHSQIGS